MAPFAGSRCPVQVLCILFAPVSLLVIGALRNGMSIAREFRLGYGNGRRKKEKEKSRRYRK
jgi:hypothetical protein